MTGHEHLPQAWTLYAPLICLLPLDAFVTLSMVIVCAAFNDLAEGQRLMERASQRMAQGVSRP